MSNLTPFENTTPHTGQNSAQALVRYGIARKPLNIGPVTPAAKALVMPESVVPLFEVPRRYENHFRTPGTAPGKHPPLSDFDRLVLHGFVESFIGPFMRYLDSEDIDPIEAESIMEALKP